MILPITEADTLRHQRLMAKARDLEAAFLSEMLSYSGLGAAEEAFGGSKDESQFASFLRQEQARLIVQDGGLGLAEMIFRAMIRAENGAT